jgi:hypothetical protein
MRETAGGVTSTGMNVRVEYNEKAKTISERFVYQLRGGVNICGNRRCIRSDIRLGTDGTESAEGP